jgi:hypothetical protein
MDPVFIWSGALVVTLLLVLGAAIWAGKQPDERHDDFSGEFLIKLGDGLGLDHYAERDLFGARVQMLWGSFGDFPVELEVSRGGWRPYVRVTIDFPKRLAQDLQILTEGRSWIRNHFGRLEEVELDDPTFSQAFSLFSRDPDRAEMMLSETTRSQLVRLAEEVDDVRITDDTLFFFVQRGCRRDEISTLLKKGLEIADRLFRAARLMGPRSPRAGAQHYEQAMMEQSARIAAAEQEPQG